MERARLRREMMEDNSFIDTASLASSQMANQQINLSAGNWDDEDSEESETDYGTSMFGVDSQTIGTGDGGDGMVDDATFLSAKTSKTSRTEMSAPMLVSDFQGSVVERSGEARSDGECIILTPTKNLVAAQIPAATLLHQRGLRRLRHHP